MVVDMVGFLLDAVERSSARSSRPSSAERRRPGAEKYGTASGLVRSLQLSVVLTPDQPMDAQAAWEASQPRDEWDADERERKHGHHGPDKRVGVVRGREGLDLVPEGVEPEPDLPGVAPRLVHHAPLAAEQVLGLRSIGELRAIRKEQQRLGVVGLVELP